MPKTQYPPRLSIEITPQQDKRLRVLIPWGMRRAVFRRLVDDIIVGVETYGTTFLARVIDGRIGIGYAPSEEELHDAE